jgi:hypothetical protein
VQRRVDAAIGSLHDAEPFASAGTDDDPICLRRGCGKPRSQHSRMGSGCPGVKHFQAGVFDRDTERKK